MDKEDKNHIGDTERIRPPPKVATDANGRTKWMAEIESCVLELESAESTNPYDSANTIGLRATILR